MGLEVVEEGLRILGALDCQKSERKILGEITGDLQVLVIVKGAYIEFQ